MLLLVALALADPYASLYLPEVPAPSGVVGADVFVAGYVMPLEGLTIDTLAGVTAWGRAGGVLDLGITVLGEPTTSADVTAAGWASLLLFRRPSVEVGAWVSGAQGSDALLFTTAPVTIFAGLAVVGDLGRHIHVDASVPLVRSFFNEYELVGSGAAFIGLYTELGFTFDLGEHHSLRIGKALAAGDLTWACRYGPFRAEAGWSTMLIINAMHADVGVVF